MAIYYRSQSFKHQQGLGLVEIMISLTLGLLILAGVLQMYATSSQNARSSEATSRIQENMRYALGRIQNDIKHAGNMGCFSFQSDYDSTSGLEGDDPEFVYSVLSDNSGRYQWDRFVSGANDSGVSNTDTLTVRYVRPSVRFPITASGTNSFTVDDSIDGYSDLQQYQIVTAANCNASYVFMITNDPATSGGVIEYQAGVAAPSSAINAAQSNDAAAITRIALDQVPIVTEDSLTGTPLYLFAGNDTGSFTYYIGDATDAGTGVVCDAANPQACSLYRDSSDNAPEELVQGVNNFQVNYGQDVGSNVRLTDASGATWSNIDRLQIDVAFNSINEAPTNTGSELITKDISQTINLANQIE